MKRGKQTCRILKDIRRQIAEANNIEFITSECQYQGDCLGTCPKCEAEVRYLEQQLARRQMAGKAITILGISAGIVAMNPMTSCNSSSNQKINQEITSDTTNFNDNMFGEIVPVPTKDTISSKKEKIPATATKKEAETPPDFVTVGFIDSTGTPPSTSDTLTTTDIMPEFPGGAKGLMQFISKNLKYQEPIVQGQMVHGRVIVQVIINKDGEVVLPEIVRSLDPYLDKEALRVVSIMPKWKPGELADGSKVAVKYTFPVIFKLQ